MKIQWLDRKAGAPLPFYCLVRNEADFQKLLKKAGVKHHIQWVTSGKGATTHFIPTPSGEIVAIVCVGHDKNLEKGQAYAMLAHEAVHIWQHYAAEIGEETPSSEYEAYTIQGIVQALLYAYDPSLSKKAPKP